MKTITNKFLGWGSALVLVAGLASSAIAGPGPQYWQQQERNRADNAAKSQTTAQSAKSTDTPAMACASCKTSDVTQYRPAGAGGKIAARSDKVGTQHTCSACGGAVTTTRGNMTSDMKANCPICAKAQTGGAACCTVTS